MLNCFCKCKIIMLSFILFSSGGNKLIALVFWQNNKSWDMLDKASHLCAIANSRPPPLYIHFNRSSRALNHLHCDFHMHVLYGISYQIALSCSILKKIIQINIYQKCYTKKHRRRLNIILFMVVLLLGLFLMWSEWSSF